MGENSVSPPVPTTDDVLFHIEDRLNNVALRLRGMVRLFDRWFGDGGNDVPDDGIVVVVRDTLEHTAAELDTLSEEALHLRCRKAVA